LALPPPPRYSSLATIGIHVREKFWFSIRQFRRGGLDLGEGGLFVHHDLPTIYPLVLLGAGQGDEGFFGFSEATSFGVFCFFRFVDDLQVPCQCRNPKCGSSPFGVFRSKALNTGLPPRICDNSISPLSFSEGGRRLVAASSGNSACRVPDLFFRIPSSASEFCSVVTTAFRQEKETRVLPSPRDLQGHRHCGFLVFV